MIKKTYPQEYYKKLDNLSALIKEYRLANGYTQIELAENLNLHRNTLSRVERGYDCHILNLIEIAQTLEIDLAELFMEVKWWFFIIHYLTIWPFLLHKIANSWFS